MLPLIQWAGDNIRKALSRALFRAGNMRLMDLRPALLFRFGVDVAELVVVVRNLAFPVGKFAAGGRTGRIDTAAHILILEDALAVNNERLKIIPRVRIFVVNADVLEPGFLDLEAFVLLEDIGDLKKTDAHAMTAAAAVRAHLAMLEVGLW